MWHLPVLRAARQRMLAKGIAAAVEHRSPFLNGTSSALERLCANVASELSFTRRRTESLRTAALLCDLGLCSVSSELLRKPLEWTPSEQAVFDRHAGTGAMILKNNPLLAHYAPIVNHHHARFETATKAPLESRVLSVCSDYLQLINHVGRDRAILAIERQSGFHYDPEVVEAVRKVVSREA